MLLIVGCQKQRVVKPDPDKQHWPPMALYLIMLVTSSTLYRLHYITSVPVRWSEARPVEPS